MVSNTASTDWVISQVLVYERKKEKYQQRLWRPWLWRGILWGIPVILLWGVLGVYVPVIAAEINYQTQTTRQNLEEVFPEGVKPDFSWQILPGWVQGYALEIPKLGIREQVIEGVDPMDELGYMEALKNGVAHAKGTKVPGEKGVQYYFGHSSGLPFWGERAVVFALLHKLEDGDEILVYRDNRKYKYMVVEKMVVNSDQVEWLTSEGGEERVVLQTCWPIGTNWKRLLVIAKAE